MSSSGSPAPSTLPEKAIEGPSAGTADLGSSRRLVAALGLAVLPLALFAAIGARARLPPGGYLAVHALVEIASVAMALATFAVQWQAAGPRTFEDVRARIVGTACLGVAVLESFHLLSYPGMPGLAPAASADRGLAYWLLARSWMVAALLAAGLRSRSTGPGLGRRHLLLVGGALALALLLLPPLLPGDGQIFYAEGRGPTRLARALEAAIALLAATAAALHARQHRRTGDGASLKLAAALALTVLTETCFAMRGSLFDGWSLLGHAYQLASWWLVLGAFVGAAVRPLNSLEGALAELAQLRRRVEGHLAESADRLEVSARRERLALAELVAINAAAPDGLVVYRPDASILRINAAAERIFGYPPGVREWPFEARWRAMRPLGADGQPVPPERSPIRRALAGETVPSCLLVIHPPQREPVWVSVSAAPILGADEAPSGAAVSISDQNLLRGLQEQRAELMSVLSHDLRNRLQMQLLQADRLQRLLADGPLERERKAADAIAAATREMGVTIRDLVDAARLELGFLSLAREPTGLRPLAEAVLARASQAVACRVRLEIPEDLPPVLVDRVQLDRVFTNLIANALRLSEASAELRIEAAIAYGDVVVSLSNRGLGLAPEEMRRIFERSYGRREGQQPDGLQLYIARLLVEAHGGRIWAESRPSEGGRITFTLPQADP